MVVNNVLSGSAETSMEKKLIRTLLQEYSDRGKMGRPIAEQNETLMVKFGLTLIQILDLDERNQVLSTNVWASYVSALLSRIYKKIVETHDNVICFIYHTTFCCYQFKIKMHFKYLLVN